MYFTIFAPPCSPVKTVDGHLLDLIEFYISNRELIMDVKAFAERLKPKWSAGEMDIGGTYKICGEI